MSTIAKPKRQTGVARWALGDIDIKYAVKKALIEWPTKDRSLPSDEQDSESHTFVFVRNIDIEIAPQLQERFDAATRDEVFRAGRQALAWLKQTPQKHRLLYLRGLTRTLTKRSLAAQIIEPSVVVALEILSEFQPDDALPILRHELTKRPLCEEHLYLVGLCHHVNLDNANPEIVEGLLDEVASVTTGMLEKQNRKGWESHLIVEASRVLSTYAPHKFVAEAGPKLPALDEMEMTAVLKDFVRSAGTINGKAKLNAWTDSAESIWQRYEQNPQLANAEGVLASLLNYFLVIGESVEQVVQRTHNLPMSTDVLYLLGMEGPRTELHDQVLGFYRNLSGRLIAEKQGRALSRLWDVAFQRGINPTELLEKAD